MIIDIGDTVLCDICSKDYTNDSESTGGILFQSKGVCPDCTPEFMGRVFQYGEQGYIRGECPKNMSFRDWILSLRGGDNQIIINHL